MIKNETALPIFVRDGAFILWPPTVLLVLHFLRQIFLPQYFQIDHLAHFLGGFTIAWATSVLLKILRERGSVISLPLPLYGLLLVATVALVGAFWEFHEYILFHATDALSPDFDIWSDSISDLALDILGGVVWVAARLLRNKNP